MLLRLVEPSPTLLDPEDRRRSRLLVALLMAICPLGLGSLLVQLLLVDGFLPVFVTGAVTVVLLTGTAVLARGRHFRFAATAAMVLIVLAVSVVGLMTPTDTVWWAYGLIPVLLGTLLLPLPSAAGVTALYLAVEVLVGVFNDQSWDVLLPPLMFSMVFSPLLLVTAAFQRALNEAGRREVQLAAHLLEEAQRLARVGHWLWDPSTDRLQTSPSLERILGRPLPAQGLQGLVECLDEDSQRVVTEAMRAPDGPRSGSFEVGFHMQGDGVGYGLMTSRTWSEQGRDHVIGTLQDVTERTLAAREREAFERQRADAQRLETVGRIAGGIAHDFNNLLTVIQGAAHLARETEPDGRETYLDGIDAAAERGSLLTRQLLAYARKQVLRPQRLDLVQILDEMRPVLKSIGRANLRVELESGPISVWADRSQIEQVVLNLVINARDAIPRDGHITVWLGRVDVGPAGGPLELVPCAMLAVKDDGEGVPASVRDHIFEPFYTTRADSGGTGLGLATVHGIVHQSGGIIELISDEGAGSEFRVCLPLVRPSGVRKADAEPGVRRPVRVVMVVDDDDLVVRTAAEMLERAGLSVHRACGAEEARTLWAAHKTELDAVLSDVVMPGTDGIELARELLAERSTLRVVLMSGYPSDKLAGFGDGPTPQVLGKPFTRDALLDALGVVRDRG